MSFGVFGASFATCLPLVVWCAVPLYGTILGLSLTFMSSMPRVQSLRQRTVKRLTTRPVYNSQLLFFFTTLFLWATYRGYEMCFFQGQLSLSGAVVKFIFFMASALGVAMLIVRGFNRSVNKPTHLKFTLWMMGPCLACFWCLLPMVTQLTTALLILELAGVALIWALTNLTNATSTLAFRVTLSAPKLIQALILFVWASGLSALALLLGLGLTTLDGGSANFLPSTAVSIPSHDEASFSSALFTLVFIFKFLVGGGQFLLLSWYRFLPANGLVFYLLFYYPSHLLLSTTFFAGFFLGSCVYSLGLLLALLVLTAVALLPHLGTQSSPALTLAGSSFIGLSFLVLALWNLA